MQIWASKCLLYWGGDHVTMIGHARAGMGHRNYCQHPEYYKYTVFLVYTSDRILVLLSHVIVFYLYFTTRLRGRAPLARLSARTQHTSAYVSIRQRFVLYNSSESSAAKTIGTNSKIVYYYYNWSIDSILLHHVSGLRRQDYRHELKAKHPHSMGNGL